MAFSTRMPGGLGLRLLAPLLLLRGLHRGIGVRTRRCCFFG
jgi:hypothetical protein